MKRIMKWIDHNQGLTLAVTICVGLLIWVYGCESQVGSIKDPAVKVTRPELEAEVQSISANLESQVNLLAAQAKAKFEKLDKFDELKQKLFGLAVESATTGTIDPTKIIAMVGWLLGIGATVDNRGKDKVIKTIKSNNK